LAPPDRDPIDVKITDFGIAKLLDAQGVTSTGQVLGSPAHMAPEQIEGGDVTQRADVFGLGVMLYEVMVGRLPFDGRNPAQVLRRVLDGQFTPAERARPTIGAGYSATLARALAHAADDRFPSASEFAHALREELSTLGIDSPRRELRAFLVDPQAYREEHERTIVERLTERGRRAGARGDVQVAAACYNRALAYRPDDRELIANVARLVRRERLRITLRRGALTAVLGLFAVVGVVLVARFVPKPSSGPSPVVRPAAGQPAAKVSAPPAPPLPASVATQPRARSNPRDRPPARVTPDQPDRRPDPAVEKVVEKPAEPGEGTGRVRVLVDGPQSAVVRIDGADTPWFGKIQELSAGGHTFEFIPPDDRCCAGSQTLRVDVHPSSGPNDVQTVRGRIEFRPAILDLRGPAGSTASCGPLGSFPVPSQQQIPISSPSVRVSCQLLPAPGSSEQPKEFDVTLKPGRLSTNLGQ
jgi:serine/threonine-protein kinase